MLDTLLYFPTLLLQLAPLFVHVFVYVQHRCGCQTFTPRQKDAMAEPSELSDNIYAIPKMCLVILLAQVFSLVAPVMVVAATIVMGVRSVEHQ